MGFQEKANDLAIGALVFGAINNSREARLWTLAKAWLIGERQVIQHLDMRHTLSWLDGRPYHMRIEEL